MIWRLVCQLFACRHRHTYRERRELYGLQIMHLVCDCGHAVPVLERTEAEYRQIAFSQVKPLKAKRDETAPVPSAADRARTHPKTGDEFSIMDGRETVLAGRIGKVYESH